MTQIFGCVYAQMPSVENPGFEPRPMLSFSLFVKVFFFDSIWKLGLGLG